MGLFKWIADRLNPQAPLVPVGAFRGVWNHEDGGQTYAFVQLLDNSQGNRAAEIIMPARVGGVLVNMNNAQHVRTIEMMKREVEASPAYLTYVLPWVDFQLTTEDLIKIEPWRFALVGEDFAPWPKETTTNPEKKIGELRLKHDRANPKESTDAT